MHIIFPDDFVGCIDGCAAWNTTARCAGVSWVLGSPGPSGGYTCYMKWALSNGSYTYDEASAKLLQSTPDLFYPSNASRHSEHTVTFQFRLTNFGRQNWWNSRRNNGTRRYSRRISYLVKAEIGDVECKDGYGFLFE